MNLFEHGRQKQIESEQPLAARMRPRTLEEFAGQEQIVGPGRLLRRAIEADDWRTLDRAPDKFGVRVRLPAVALFAEATLDGPATSGRTVGSIADHRPRTGAQLSRDVDGRGAAAGRRDPGTAERVTGTDPAGVETVLTRRE